MEDLRTRLALHGAIALAGAAFLLTALLTLAPVEFLHSLQATTPERLPFDYGSHISFGLFVAAMTTLAAGLLGFLAWRFLIVATGSFAFIPGALCGGAVALCVAFGLTLALAEWLMVGPVGGAVSGPEALGALFGIGFVLSVPATIAGGLVGGVVASTQRAVLLDSEDERRLPIHPPR